LLTDTRCRNAKPLDRPYKLADSNGLILEIKPNGVKAWRYRFKIAGKESMYAIGEYGSAPAGETDEEAKTRRAAGLFTLPMPGKNGSRLAPWSSRASTLPTSGN